MKEDTTLHYGPLMFQCPQAQTTWARGTSDPEKVTCHRCFANMAQSTSNRLHMPNADEEVCPACKGGCMDPNNVRQWCPRCQGSGKP